MLKMNLQLFGGRGSAGGNNPNSSTILSRNLSGQELKIPKATFEKRLAQLEKTKKDMLDEERPNPTQLRKIDEQIETVRESLRTGVDQEEVVVMRDLSETVETLDSYKVPYTYHASSGGYLVSKNDYAKLLKKVKNPQYIKNITGRGGSSIKTSSRITTIAGK